MSRRVKSKPHVGISVFSFLDALICTLGALIVLLAVAISQGHVQAKMLVAAEVEAAKEVGPTDAEVSKAHSENLADIDWEAQTLKKQRDERLEQLTQLRQQLAHVEDHLRRLQEQAQALLDQARSIDEGKQLGDAELNAAREELARKRQEIEDTKTKVAKLKQERTEKERWFALIPYDGPNGTRRRPVYIECTEAGIVLQPEAIVLMPDDFNGPLGPGNPLDAALKAKREYLERNGEKALPYPLLIVRPDGIVAYMVARAALKSWEEEFGYELIDAERKLAFGEPDPQLAQTITQTVRQARQRQARMMASMPGRYHEQDNLQSFNTADAVAQMPESQMTGRGLGGGNAAGGSIGNTSRGNPDGGVGSGGSGQGGIGNGSGINFASANPGGTGANANRNGTGNNPGNPYNSNTPGMGSQGGQAGQPGTNSTAQGGSAASGQQQSSGAGGRSSAGGQQASSAGSSQWSSVAGQASSANGAGGSSSAGGANMSGGTPQQGGTQVSMGNMGASGSSSGQAAKPGQRTSRGTPNWGLLNASGKAVAVTRPIRVALQNHQIIVLPDKGDTASPVVIPLTDRDLSGAEIDFFVQTVQKRIEGWGIAAENGYWKPELSMDVAANADGRFQQWEQALAGSGYELKRKQR